MEISRDLFLQTCASACDNYGSSNLVRDDPMMDTLMSDRDAATALGCSRSTLWRWSADGTVPKPLKIGGMTRWKKSDLESVIAKAEAARNAT